MFQTRTDDAGVLEPSKRKSPISIWYWTVLDSNAGNGLFVSLIQAPVSYTVNTTGVCIALML